VLEFLTLRRDETTVNLTESKEDREQRIGLGLAFVALAVAIGSVSAVYLLERDSPNARRGDAPTGVALYRMPIPF
jgi:hypothetical protein